MPPRVLLWLFLRIESAIALMNLITGFSSSVSISVRSA